MVRGKVWICVLLGSCARDRLERQADPAAETTAFIAENCGNGQLDRGEQCDPKIVSGRGQCVAECLPVSACYRVALLGQGCGVRCEVVEEIVWPEAGDGCCPQGATALDDPDCDAPAASCGNGVVEPSELCDVGVANGPGACPRACAATNACSTSALLGQGCLARCDTVVATPTATDGCCPGPMFAGQDSDCPGRLGWPGSIACPILIEHFGAELLWEWNDAPLMLRTTATTHTTPVVAQFTDDDIPDVLVVMAGFADMTGLDELETLPAVIALLSGDDGHQHWRLSGAPYGVMPFVSPAAADIDGDGKNEIVTATIGDSDVSVGGLVAFEHDGTLKWLSEPFAIQHEGDGLGAVSVADLDGDGNVELVFGSHVFDRDGRLVWFGQAPLPGGISLGRIGVVADLGEPAGLEVVDGGLAYSSRGDLLWTYDRVGHAHVTIADCDADGEAELLLSGQPSDMTSPTLALLNHDGTERVGPTRVAGLTPNSPGAAGDLDGDGKPEFVFGATNRLVALDCSLNVVMSSDLIVDVSGASGVVLFDFDADGRMELIYGDEWTFYVLDGTGHTLWKTGRRSMTGLETPVVADVDNDGEADLVVPQSRMQGESLPRPIGVKVYRSAGARWSGTLPIWNQHAFRAMNVFPDGHVPALEGPWWQTFNAFRATVSIAPPGQSCPGPGR